MPAEEKASATRVEETIQSILYEQRMEVRLRPGYVPGTRVVADPDTEHGWAREFNGELHVSEETFNQLLCTGCAAVNVSVWLKHWVERASDKMGPEPHEARPSGDKGTE
jgi:hypothetical protein